MRVLFVIRNHGYLRNFTSTIEELARRGHEIVIASRGPERHMPVDAARFASELSAAHPSVRFERLPRRADRWAELASVVRAYRNAVRYAHPRLVHASSLRRRALDHLRRRAPRLADHGVPRSWPAARWCLQAAGLVEAAIPSDPALDAAIAAIAPDAVLVSPLVDFNSNQVDYVKASHRLGIPVGLCVASWDNLTNKGLVSVAPDQVFVWNEIQRDEAVALHGIPPAHVTVTGAPFFDDWFARQASTSREAFCRTAGLDPARPFVLYLCSSLFIATTEVEFVRTWVQRLRASRHPLLSECGVLVRPHPGNAAPWAAAGDWPPEDRVVVWPPRGAFPLDEPSKADYFDSLFHAAAVVGLNTTGLLEAGVVGRRTFTWETPEFAATQSGTVHFGYLSGFLTSAADAATHLDQLAEELEHPAPRALTDPFLKAFIRPQGLEDPSTPLLASAIEDLAALPCTPTKDAPAARLLRWLLAAAVRRRAASRDAPVR